MLRVHRNFCRVLQISISGQNISYLQIAKSVRNFASQAPATNLNKRVIFLEKRIKNDATTKGLPKLIFGKWESSFCIVEKPPGLETYEKYNSADSLEKRLKPVLDGRIIAFPYILEKWASGLVIVCFRRWAEDEFSKLIQNGELVRKFRVITNIPPCLQATYYKSPNTELAKTKKCCFAMPSVDGSILNFKAKNFITDSGELTHITTQRDEATSPSPFILPSWASTPAMKFMASTKSANTLEPKKAKCIEKCEYCSSEKIIESQNHPWSPSKTIYTTSDQIPEESDTKQSKAKKGTETTTSFKLENISRKTGNALFEMSPVKNSTVNKFKAQLAASAFPVVGDFIYNPFVIQKVMETVYKGNQKAIDKEDKEARKKFDFENPALFNTGERSKEIGVQAHYLSFQHPKNKQQLEFTLPLPDNWKFIEK